MEPNKDKPVDSVMQSERISDSPSSPSESNGVDQVTELRRIIVGPDQVSEVLPDAVSKSSNSGTRLSEATLPLVEQNIRDSVIKNPKILAEALFPVIGPAIRKAISAALSSMVQSFNQTLEYSVSPKGLKWRLEAARTGRTFGEVVMLKTLQYRVEQVFLIHRETGLLLQHVSLDPDDVEDADMVGAMLTAITDFAQDSFDEVDPNATLDSFKISGLQVWVENSSDLILAGVIRGNPPIELRQTFVETAEEIQLGFKRELKSYEGNADVFEAARPNLEACLLSRSTEEEKKSGLLSPANLTLGFAGLALLLVFGYFAWDYWKWTSLLDDFRNEPGYVLTDYQRGWFSHRVSGLRDPLAGDPNAILDANRYDSGDVSFDWREYQDMRPDFVLKRANSLLKPKKGTSLRIEGKTLLIKGAEDKNWLDDAKRIGRAIAGVDEVREEVDEAAVIRRTGIEFNCGTVEVKDNSLLTRVSDLVEQMSQKGPVTLEVIGSASNSGEDEINDKLSAGRADVVKERILSSVSRRGAAKNLKIETKSSNEYSDCKVTFEVDPQ